MSVEDKTATQSNTKRWSAQQIAAIVALALFVHLVIIFNFLMMLGNLNMNAPGPAGLMLGLTFAQAAIVAIYLAWGTQRFLVRCIIAIACLSCVGVCIGRSTESPADTFLWLLALLPTGLCVANVVPLAAMRLIYGVRLRYPNETSTDVATEKYQFGIWQLLIATSVIACVLGLARLFIGNFRDDVAELGNDFTEIMMILAALLVFSVVTSWLTVLFSLAAHSVYWVLVIILVCMAVAHLELMTFSWVQGRNAADVWQVFYALQSVQLVGITWPLVALRVCGLQLVRAG